MTDPRWIPLRVIHAIHDRQIARHGGSPALRDGGLLEAGIARLMRCHAAGDTDLRVLATAYAFGIAKAHAFVDGNNRTAFVTCVTFLRVNETEPALDQVEIVRMMERVASGQVSEGAFADWLGRGAIMET